VPAASSRPPYWAAPNSTFRRFRRFAQARPSGRAACHRCTCCGVARRGREDGRALTAATAREAGGCRCEPREEHVPAFLPTKAPPVSVWIEPEASPSIMCPCFSTLVFLKTHNKTKWTGQGQCTAGQLQSLVQMAGKVTALRGRVLTTGRMPVAEYRCELYVSLYARPQGTRWARS
jgi:hypothetical protein